MLRVFVWLFAQALVVGASMAPFANLGANELAEGMRTGNVVQDRFNGPIGGNSIPTTINYDNNVNNVMDLLLGSIGRHSSERNSIHSQLTQEHHHHHYSRNDMPDTIDMITMSERDVENFDDDDSFANNDVVAAANQAIAHAHHKSAHHSKHHPHHSSSHATQHVTQHKSHHRHQPEAHQPHRRHHGRPHSQPSQVADVIEELEVSGDAPSNVQTAPAAKPQHQQQPQPQQQSHSAHNVDPHLRDKLVKEEKVHHHHHSENPKKHLRGVPTEHRQHENTKAVADDDEVPLDEFGLKKDCHWIQMDFTQNSDNCNQCMTIADAYFRGDDICACYKDNPGALLRKSCRELSEKFKGNEDHIRQLAIDNQWNEYYKSYGLCENYGHCGS